MQNVEMITAFVDVVGVGVVAWSAFVELFSTEKFRFKWSVQIDSYLWKGILEGIIKLRTQAAMSNENAALPICLAAVTWIVG